MSSEASRRMRFMVGDLELNFAVAILEGVVAVRVCEEGVGEGEATLRLELGDDVGVGITVTKAGRYHRRDFQFEMTIKYRIEEDFESTKL